MTEAVVCPLLASKAFQPCIQDTLSSRAALGLPLYITRYPIVARALGRVRARAKESCIQGLPAVQPSGRVRRASKGILHTNFNPTSCGVDIRCMVYTTIRAPAKGGKYYSVISGIKRISTCGAIRYQRSKFTSIEPMITASDPFRKSMEFDDRVI